MDEATAPLLRAAGLVLAALLLYPPLAWLDRWAQIAPGAGAKLSFNPLLPIANALKLMQKRAALPGGADRFVHNLAPLVALTPALLTLAAIPPAPPLATAQGSVHLGVAGGEGSVAAALALLLLSAAGVAAAGWAGANRLALLAALRLVLLRTAALVVFGLGAAGVCLIHSTFRFDALVAAQVRPFLMGAPALGVLVNPVGFACAIAGLAVLGQRQARSRPDEHADLVDPYATEASGPALLLHRVFEVLDQLALAAVVATVFLGGWTLPGIDTPESAATLALPLQDAALRVAALIGKTLFAATLVLLVRRSLPPLRHDQALSLMWVLVAVSAVGLAVSSVVYTRVPW